jgi:long-chain acyl-CoA synthetase
MAEFFHAAGILICEGYGLTRESSAASFVNRPEKFRFGTVGLPVPGVQVKIAEEGEILLGGKAIMQGYYGLQEATTEALTEDRWLRTGDIGELDAEGFLRITDRKKDLIKTSGGKYVAPQKLEGTLNVQVPLPEPGDHPRRRPQLLCRLGDPGRRGHRQVGRRKRHARQDHPRNSPVIPRSRR